MSADKGVLDDCFATHISSKVVAPSTYATGLYFVLTCTRYHMKTIAIAEDLPKQVCIINNACIAHTHLCLSFAMSQGSLSSMG
jgi:hypothetical protein